METSAAGDPAHPGRLPGLPASSIDGHLGSWRSSASWAPLRPFVQLHRRRARPPVFRRILGAFQAFRPAGPMETSAAGDPARPGKSIALQPTARPPVIQRLLPAFQAFRPAGPTDTSAAILPAHPARLPGLPPSRSDGDLGSYPSSASCPPSRPSAQPVRRTPRQLSFQRVLPAFQVFLPARPARLPGLPASRSDGDLGSYPSSGSWAPSRPPAGGSDEGPPRTFSPSIGR